MARSRGWPATLVWSECPSAGWPTISTVSPPARRRHRPALTLACSRCRRVHLWPRPPHEAPPHTGHPRPRRRIRHAPQDARPRESCPRSTTRLNPNSLLRDPGELPPKISPPSTPTNTFISSPASPPRQLRNSHTMAPDVRTHLSARFPEYLTLPPIPVLVGDDNPGFEGLFEFCSISAGGSICASYYSY
jgi:hypothetical protein